MQTPRSGGGWPALAYTWRMARQVGGIGRLYQALRRRNACKTCALGMGGQQGGLVNEAGHFPEVCKKSMQAMAADMQDGLTPAFFERYSVAELQALSPHDLEHAGRLAEPLVLEPGATHYRPITWDAALDLCGASLRATDPNEAFFYFSGRASNEAAFAWQLFARLYGTNHVNNCSYYCHQASGVGLTSSIGTGTATVQLDDLHHCDLFFLIGGNPASNHPRLMTTLADIRRRGGDVIVINPLRETGLVNFSIPSRPLSLLFGTSIASEYVQPNIGGDIAVLVGIAKQLDAWNTLDRPFLTQATEGLDEYIQFLRACPWEQIEQAGGVKRGVIRRIAKIYADARAAVFAWTMGITHHTHGVDNVRAIANLALLRGMIGRPHAGLLPIRGHSNVQGVGSVGVTPTLKKAIFERIEQHFGLQLPTTPGLDTLGCMQAMQAGRMRMAVCLGGNLFGSNPDARATAAAFAETDTVVYLSTTLNTGHAWGLGKRTLILPVRARDEEEQATTQESMFNFVRQSDGGPARIPGARSEVAIVADLADRVLGSDGPVDWAELRDHRNLRRTIAAVVPGFQALERIETDGEFQIDGRTLHRPTFPTETGRARLHVTPIPQRDLAPDELLMMTIRSEGQFNTVVYEEHDLYRGQERRDVILLSREDIDRLGLRPEQRIRVYNDTGEMTVLVRVFDLPPGNAAMYFPEANVLVPRVRDDESRTPAFKAVAVRIAAEASGTPLPVRSG